MKKQKENGRLAYFASFVNILVRDIKNFTKYYRCCYNLFTMQQQQLPIIIQRSVWQRILMPWKFCG